MTHEQRLVLVAIAAALAIVFVKETIIGHPRWWNLVMAGLLVIALVMYLVRARRDE